MSASQAKVQADHLARQAYIYVRQSSMTQVCAHQESTRRQYDLRIRARQLGWTDERIVVLDADLGQSASDAHQVRIGFQKLLADVVVGRVGGIVSLEVSRLARQDSEGHRLVEVAALTGTLLIDEQQVYDPRLADDRLMLGLKVLLSSNELRQMSIRLWENKLRKAQRGELRINLPTGLVFDPQQGIVLDPDEQVQAAVRLLFERFRLSSRISNVARYFQQHGLHFPKRANGWNAPLQWGPLSCHRVRAVICNPLYAGAYVYGRTTSRNVVKPLEQMHQAAVRLKPEDWQVALWDAFPSYISRTEFEANQAQLERRRRRPADGGRRRDGAALLSGIVLCGRCGRRMHVIYSGRERQQITYICNDRQRRYAQKVCQRISGRSIDQAVAQAVLEALTPAQIELSLAVAQEMERQQAQLRKQWELRLEGAAYSARLAQRRYELVDPENRLVARHLEREWEARLAEIAQLKANFARQQNQSPLYLNSAQRQQLHNLVQDLPRVWHAQTTSWTERKDLLELLIADVTLTRQETDVLVQIRWQTNELDTFRVPLPVRGAPPVPGRVVERVRTLSQTKTDAEIAEILNADGIRTSQDKPFTARLVLGLRRRHKIRKHSLAPDL